MNEDITFYLDPSDLPALLILLLLALIALLAWRPLTNASPALGADDGEARSPAEAISRTLARLLERSGRLVIYIAPTRLLGPAATDTTSALRTAGEIAASAGAGGVQTTIVSGDAVTYLATQSLIRPVNPPTGRPLSVSTRFAGADRASLAADALLTIESERPQALVSQGHWDEEFTHLLDVGSKLDMTHHAGSSSFSALPFIYLAGRQGALGEQLFSLADELREGHPPTVFETARVVLLAGLLVIGLAGLLGLWPI